MQGVVFQNQDYRNLILPPNSIVLNDPPYKSTSSYANEICHDDFWDGVRMISKQGHQVYVCEYNAPDDFECIWQKTVKSSLSANGRSGGSKESIEKLFKYQES